MEDFEKKIKDFFQRREIKPSADAWQRMEHLLNEPQAKPKNAYRIYWAVAASVVVLFGLFTLLQKQDSELIQPASNNVYVSKDTLSNKIQQPQNHHPIVKTAVVPQKTEDTKKQSAIIKKVPAEIVQNIKNQPQEYEVGQPIESYSIIQKADREIEEKPLIAASKVEIKVNPSKLLRSAEMERQTDNMVSNGQNFWKKIKEINTVVAHSK
ncbi:hypothetical protein [Flavobacterium sp. N2155]|nr:hypothetical protein [Flavobacterium sp. N2155]